MKIISVKIKEMKTLVVKNAQILVYKKINNAKHVLVTDSGVK